MPSVFTFTLTIAIFISITSVCTFLVIYLQQLFCAKSGTASEQQLCTNCMIRLKKLKVEMFKVNYGAIQFFV